MPDIGRKFIARTVDEPVGIADRDREPIRKGEQPFDLSVDDAKDCGLTARRRDLEMDVENAAKFVWRRQVRKDVLRDPWGHAEDHGIARAKLLLRSVKVERNGALALETDCPEAVAETNRRPSRGEKGKRGVDEAAGEAMGGEQRVAGLSPGGEGLPQQSRGERCRALRGIGVERRGQERAPQPLVKRALTAHRLT